MNPSRTAIAIGLGILLLVAGVIAGVVLYRADVDTRDPLTVSWGGDDGHPACVYQRKRKTVTATVSVTGDAAGQDSVTITVASYADENTRHQVGSETREVGVDGRVDTEVDLTMRVRRPPHVDEDGVVACTLDADGAIVD
ncbi:hypothetical protein [Nocardioides mangrovi]|uniref:DUF4307 domain-containing protein n=1 Tax=Nocardioides mangrovi TaxID=2874580 RepID=A0ABS7UDI3_9ACTN|nr:hypothetical protein [Nocardioides mangrovi]MBZ5738842.1 hypothetical protein [Nocardioides mangrovi]